MSRFADYNEHTEAMITWLLDRWAEDEALVGAMRRPRLLRAFLAIESQRGAVNDYRSCAARAFSSTSAARRLWWERAARYHALSLRVAAGAYSDRAGFDPAWRRSPRS